MAPQARASELPDLLRRGLVCGGQEARACLRAPPAAALASSGSQGLSWSLCPSRKPTFPFLPQGTFAGLLIGLAQLNCSELKLKRLCCRHG